MSRDYADPPIIDPARDAPERRASGRALRAERPRREVLAGRQDSDLTVLLAGPRAKVVPVATPRQVLLDLIDVDDMLPGSFEVDLRIARAALTARSPHRRHADLAHALGFGYAEAIDHASTAHAHDRLEIARRWSAQVGKRVVKSHSSNVAWSYDGAVEAVVHSSGSRLRRGRVRHLLGDPARDRALTDPGSSWESEWRQYRETLTEDEQELLRWYTPIEALAVGDSLIVLARGPQIGDLLLLLASAVGPSPLEQQLGLWRQGSDVQRVLVARTRVPLVPQDFLGWSTSSDGSIGRVWGRLRVGRLHPPSTPSGRREEARDHGRILGLSHARTGDVHALRGYVGNPTAFARALAGSIAPPQA